jgi:hypothetical protein
VGAIWLVTEIVTKVSDSAEHWVKQHGGIYSAVVIVAAIIWFIHYIYEPRSVSFQVPTTDTKISIRYDDLLQQPTSLLVGVGEFFDSSLGHVVSQNSLHGKVISTFYNGDEARFRSEVDLALIGHEPTATNRGIQPSSKYEIGTTAVLNSGRQKIFLVAMARVDLQTAKASSDVPTLWTALQRALLTIRDCGNGNPLSMPLIGNGQSSVNIAPQHLLRLLVLVLVDFGRKFGLPKEVNIILPDACFDKLDIREVSRDWRKS